MKDIAIVMVTMDRSPRVNYLGETLDNLARSGVFRSPRLHSFTVADSRSGTFAADEISDHGIEAAVLLPAEHRTANRNVARALKAGAESGAPWVLFLEDDIDVCSNFLNGVGRWLDRNSVVESQVYSFGAAYDILVPMFARGEERWQYPAKDFYGTQAFAVRFGDARELSIWINHHADDVDRIGAYDILMHGWAEYREISHFCASVPSFVQHIGRESIIAPRPTTHVFQSWPGRDWEYRR